jgi:hypothetical protein
VQQKPGAKAHQARRVKPGVVDRQAERNLPAQIKAHRFHRSLVGEAVAVGEQQHLGEHARRDRRAAMPLRVALGEILVANNPLAVLGQQRVDRLLRQQTRTPRRIKETLLPIRHRKHPPPPEECPIAEKR